MRERTSRNIKRPSRSRRPDNRERGNRENRVDRDASFSPKAQSANQISEEELAQIQESYAAYQEEKAGRERPKRATSIDEILGGSDEPEEPYGL